MALTVSVHRGCHNAHAARDTTPPLASPPIQLVHPVASDIDVLEARTKSLVLLVLTVLEAPPRPPLVSHAHRATAVQAAPIKRYAESILSRRQELVRARHVEVTVLVDRDRLNAHAVRDITHRQDLLLRLIVHRVVQDIDVLEPRTKSLVPLVPTVLEAPPRLLLV